MLSRAIDVCVQIRTTYINMAFLTEYKIIMDTRRRMVAVNKWCKRFRECLLSLSDLYKPSKSNTVYSIVCMKPITPDHKKQQILPTVCKICSITIRILCFQSRLLEEISYGVITTPRIEGSGYAIETLISSTKIFKISIICDKFCDVNFLVQF